MNTEFPEKLQFLFEPHPYKVIWGGRDGIKSWSVAQALLIMGAQYKLRWLCARETQASVAESVHQLLEEQIIRLGLSSCYRVEKHRIVGTVSQNCGMYGRKLDHPGMTEFVFAGLRHNVNQIKSFEALDGVWCEEANNISKNSWEVVLPTIRKDGSEIWITFNPEFDGDDTHVRWVLNPPPGAVVVKTGYEDNNWLSEASRIKIDHLRITDPEAFRTIYGGETRSSVQGAIYAAEIAEAEKEGRIGNVPRDRTRPTSTYWDLGFGDDTAIWFAQAMPDGTFRIIDYLENHGKTIEWYVIQLNQKGYLYGIDWLPHDGVDMIIHKKLGADPTRSIEMLMRNAGRKIRIAPKQHVSSGINAARTIFSNCWFDREKCADGLQGLRHYQWAPVTAGGVVARAPLHNFASHSADAFRTLAYGIKSPEKELPPPPPAAPANEYSWMG